MNGIRQRELDPHDLAPDMGADDATVIARSMDEPETFAILFDRHAPHLHGYVVRRLGPSAAEDVVARTFLIAFQRRGDYDRARPDAAPWLFGIASNVIGRHRRTETSLYRAYVRSGVHPAEVSGALVEDGVGALAVNRPLAGQGGLPCPALTLVDDPAPLDENGPSTG
ncbi:sigma factor [Nonomuraea sp. NPDC049421]|uniref:RNA polymerase sigma factor n=1 Tax=Nonomuraea sp. NPDC049421 TaxID=3155275 RepID=UPI003421ED4E